MSNLTIASIFVLTLNILMWLSQVAILDLNPTGTTFYNCNGSMLETFGSGCSENAVLNTQDVTDKLPSSGETISTDTGNFFTDVFNNVLSWVKETTGLGYLISILSAPYNLLKVLNLPNAFVYAVGTLWYGVSFMIFIAFIWGREQ